MATGTTLEGSTNFINNFVNPFSDLDGPDFITPFNANGTVVAPKLLQASGQRIRLRK